MASIDDDEGPPCPLCARHHTVRECPLLKKARASGSGQATSVNFYAAESAAARSCGGGERVAEAQQAERGDDIIVAVALTVGSAGSYGMLLEKRQLTSDGDGPYAVDVVEINDSSPANGLVFVGDELITVGGVPVRGDHANAVAQLSAHKERALLGESVRCEVVRRLRVGTAPAASSVGAGSVATEFVSAHQGAGYAEAARLAIERRKQSKLAGCTSPPSPAHKHAGGASPCSPTPPAPSTLSPGHGRTISPASIGGAAPTPSSLTAAMPAAAPVAATSAASVGVRASDEDMPACPQPELGTAAASGARPAGSICTRDGCGVASASANAPAAMATPAPLPAVPAIPTAVATQRGLSRAESARAAPRRDASGHATAGEVHHYDRPAPNTDRAHVPRDRRAISPMNYRSVRVAVGFGSHNAPTSARPPDQGVSTGGRFEFRPPPLSSRAGFSPPLSSRAGFSPAPERVAVGSSSSRGLTRLEADAGGEMLGSVSSPAHVPSAAEEQRASAAVRPLPSVEAAGGVSEAFLTPRGGTPIKRGGARSKAAFFEQVSPLCPRRKACALSAARGRSRYARASCVTAALFTCHCCHACTCARLACMSMLYSSSRQCRMPHPCRQCPPPTPHLPRLAVPLHSSLRWATQLTCRGKGMSRRWHARHAGARRSWHGMPNRGTSGIWESGHACSRWTVLVHRHIPEDTVL